MKLNRIELCGFRGIRNHMVIQLPSSSSLLIYGENGGGKSSVTDGLEWFLYDRVDHLSSQEIGRKGIPALRNMRLNKDEEAFVKLDLSNPELTATKTLSSKRTGNPVSFSTTSPEFATYLDATAAENIILRYRDLLEFILFTKSDKLAEVSRLIGFGEVSKTRKTLQKATNDLARREKIRDFDSQISRQQAEIIEHLGQNVTNETQFVEAARSLLQPLNLTVDVTDAPSLVKAISQLKDSADEKTIALEISFGKVCEALQAVKEGRDICRSLYAGFYDNHRNLRKDSNKTKGLEVARLLEEGVSVLDGTWERNSCPLCLQPKDRVDLKSEITQRREQLSELSKELSALEEAKKNVADMLNEFIGRLKPALMEHCLRLENNKHVKSAVEAVTNSLVDALDGISKFNIIGDNNLVLPADFLVFRDVDLSTTISLIEEKKNMAGQKRQEDLRFAVAESLSLAKRAYREVVALRVEQANLRRQINTMESIYKEFVKHEKEALTLFLAEISEDINALYLFMNANERVEGISLIPMGDMDEFVGITFEMTFHGETVSPPEKYLSESHLNCLGICLFLATAMAFNKTNQFLILDDVISSFDTNHRVRFGNLLKERFSNYQILLFTHEKTWFDYMTNLVKGVGWDIHRVVWDEDTGVQLGSSPSESRTTIENKLTNSDTEGLGNLIRKYLEGLLKQTCAGLNVQLPFRFNANNEDRMLGEMLPALLGTLKRRECELKDAIVVRRMLTSTFLANKLSHDSHFIATTGDLRALWADVNEFEKLFVCGNCSRMINSKKVDRTRGTIYCGCGRLTYAWKV